MRSKFCELFLCIIFISCSAFAKVKLGIDVLEESGFSVLNGKRVGLLTTSACTDSHGISSWEIMQRYNVNIQKIFTPEKITKQKTFSGTFLNEKIFNGIQIFSCYNSTVKPSPELLANIDIMVIDLQDVGVRYYTYISSMIYMMFMCFENDIEVIVLDRPNPISGIIIGGPCIDNAHTSFLGCIPNMPFLHGMTIGEIAMYIKDFVSNHGLHAKQNKFNHTIVPGLDINEGIASTGKLNVVKMQGWRRGMIWNDTLLHVVPLSERIQTESAFYDYAILSMSTFLSESYNDVLEFYPVNDYVFGPTKRYFACFSAKNIDTSRLMQDLERPEYDVCTNGLRLLDISNDESPKFLLKVEDIRKIEPCALSLFLIKKVQGSTDWSHLNSESLDLLRKHIGDQELVECMINKQKIDFNHFISKWQKQAKAFKKATSRFYLYR